jgi:hypothetical protein
MLEMLEMLERTCASAAHIRYRYTSFFWSKSEVAMFFKTSGNSADTSLPKVMAMMVFWIASFLQYVRMPFQPQKEYFNSIPFVGIL